MQGTVRSLMDYGAFVDIGGIDGLLHVSDISLSRVKNPADVLSVGQEIEARVLRIDRDKQRISLGLKQLQPRAMGQRRRQIQNRRTRARNSFASHGLRCIRRA